MEDLTKQKGHIPRHAIMNDYSSIRYEQHDHCKLCIQLSGNMVLGMWPAGQYMNVHSATTEKHNPCDLKTIQPQINHPSIQALMDQNNKCDSILRVQHLDNKQHNPQTNLCTTSDVLPVCATQASHPGLRQAASRVSFRDSNDS